MSPPAEQLIRDYLNRLSVAARGQLSPEDRRALVGRTRDFIERKTGLAGPPTAVEVARLLSGLGDPSGLVSQEAGRLAVLRGVASPPQVGRLSKISRVLRREPGSASWHWPAQQGRTDLQLTLIGEAAGSGTAGDGEGPQGTATGSQPANGRAGPAAESRDAGASASQGTAVVGLSELIPLQAVQEDRSAGAPITEEPSASTKQLQADTSELIGAGGTDGQDEPAMAARVADAAAAAASMAADLAGTVIGWTRRKPLEAAAAVLLGIGGAIYPPVWLLGAALALVSKVWDYRDKWAGLGMPVLLTIAGAIAGVAMARAHSSVGHHVHLGWMFANVFSRVSAVLGASYLVWRSEHGRRSPRVPPWNRQKLG